MPDTFQYLDEEEEFAFLMTRVREIMAQKHMTMYRLSRESLVPFSSMVRWFNGTAMPSFRTLVQLCNGLGVTLSELFTR